jgi:glycosylphosphatidylinositol transamidase (GPIT) subunit GPI8
MLFNKPYPVGNTGVDVFKGCVIDYETDSMTLNNLWAAMKGDSSSVVGGSGRVLNSNSNSNLLISYDDHGGKGVVGYPGGGIYSTDLMNTLTWMKQNGRFNKMLFLMEACFSGSMFEGMSSTLGIYAITSANSDEYGWMTYCPPDDDFINGTDMNTCLGDEMNTGYLEYIDSNPSNSITLGDFFTQVIVKAAASSHPTQNGDLSMQSMLLSDFFGQSNSSITPIPTTDKKKSKIQSVDSSLMYAINRHAKEMSKYSQEGLDNEIQMRKYFDDKFNAITFGIDIVQQKSTDFDCYKAIVNQFEN